MINLKKIGGVAIVLCGLMVAAVAQDKKAADVTGTWKWSQTGRGGNATEMTLKLKKDGDKITGTVSGGRGGANGAGTEIKDVKVTGDEISFSVERAGRNGGTPITQKFNGKVSGDTIKGKIDTGRANAEPVTWEAKKDTAKADDKKADDKT